MKAHLMTCLLVLMAVQAQAFTPGERVLDISRGVFAKIVEEKRNGTFAIQHMTGPLSQVVLDGFSQDQLGAINGRIKNISVGDVVFDTYRKADALVVALSGDNKFVIRHLSGQYAGKFLAGYSVEYLKSDSDLSQQMKLETTLKQTTVETKVAKAVAKTHVKSEVKVAPEVKVTKETVVKPAAEVKEPVKEVKAEKEVKTKKENKDQAELVPVIKNDFKNKKAAVFNMLLKRNLEE